MVVLHDVLDVGVRVLAGLLGAAHDVLRQLVVVEADLVGLDDLVEDELRHDRVVDRLLELGLELVGRLLLVVEVLLERDAGERELLLDLLATGGELLRHERLGQRDVDLAQQLVEDEVAGLGGLLHALAARDALAQVGAQLLQGVELRRHLDELLVELGELGLLDLGHRDRDVDLGVLELAADEGRAERRGAAGLEARDGLVEAVEHLGAADAVGQGLGRGVLDDRAVLVRGREVEGDLVALGGSALDAGVGGEALTERLELLVDVGVGDLDRGHLDLDRGQVGELDLGPHVDLGGDLDVVAVGELGEVDLGLAERLQVGLQQGLAVPVGQGRVDGLVEDHATSDALVDDGRRDLAATEAGHLDLRADGLVGLVESGLELVERHLDGELDPGGAQVLGGALHVDDSCGGRLCGG